MIQRICKLPQAQSFLLMKVKSKDLVRKEDAKVLETLGRDVDSKSEKWLVSNDPLERSFGSTRALHWRQAIKELFE